MKFNSRNIRLGKNVKLGKNVRLGDNVVVYDNVRIGDNSVVCNDCVLGEPLGDYYSSRRYKNPPLVIGGHSLVRSHSIFYAGSIFGDGLVTGHRVTVREYTRAGRNCMFGSYTDIQGDCSIGNYVRFHSYVNIGQKSEIEDYVFIYPFVVLTNDPTPPSNVLTGVKIGEYAQICAGTVMLPGCSIGAHSLVAANSTVGGVYAEDSFIAGAPAKLMGALSKMPFFNADGQRHYPWPENFDRGMPWAKIGYPAWGRQTRADATRRKLNEEI